MFGFKKKKVKKFDKIIGKIVEVQETKEERENRIYYQLTGKHKKDIK